MTAWRPFDRPIADPVEYLVPESWVLSNTSRCPTCREPIGWATSLRTGSLAPFDPDGTSHFATCPQADAWRNREAAR